MLNFNSHKAIIYYYSRNAHFFDILGARRYLFKDLGDLILLPMTVNDCLLGLCLPSFVKQAVVEINVKSITYMEEKCKRVNA